MRVASIARATLACVATSLPTVASADGPELSFELEAKSHLRHSEDRRFAVPFPFALDELPVGATRGFMESVEPGTHVELSAVVARLGLAFGDVATLRVRLEFVDRHDRNPTSSARAFDVDEAWLRFGRESDALTPAPGFGAFLKIGKFGKFERQNDRHLESYGLVATAFNRFEDVGVAAGLDLGSRVYVRASLTEGNALFMRDPTALAGDNGLEELRLPNPDPDLGTGVVILYDGDVRTFDFQDSLEIGGALGVRFATPDGWRSLDLMGWAYQRDLDDTVAIDGSFYGGDLDLLLGPGNAFPFPVEGRRKREWGGNLWLYLGGFSLFAQYADQELAGLERWGVEAEAAWRFDEPLGASPDSAPLISHVTPVARCSRLEPRFDAPRVTPSPSFAWPWEKWDVGLRIGLGEASDLTAEYTFNRFTLGSGARARNDELLVTLRLAFGG